MSDKLVIHGPGYTVGLVSGPERNETMVCQNPHKSNGQGSIWLGYNPLAYNTSVLFIQFILIFILSRSIYFLLKPLRQSVMFAQIIAGIILGPSLLAQNLSYATQVLPLGGNIILGTAADIGIILHLFLIGVQTDVTVLRKAGKTNFIIGFSGFILAFGMGATAFYVLSKTVTIENSLNEALPFVVSLGSLSAFPVIATHLADLKILNSELGQLATFASIVSDFFNLVVVIFVGHIVTSVTSSNWNQLWSSATILIFLGVIIFLFRPTIIMIGKRIPEGKQMCENELIPIVSILLICSFISEFLGYHAALGAFLLGLSLPDGPPLGENLIHKLEIMSTGIFLPAKCGISGINTVIWSITSTHNAMIVELVIVCGYLGKFLGTLVSGLVCGLPFKEALAVALVMCCKGIVDIALFSLWNDTGMLGNLEYTLLMVSMLVVTGVARPLISYLYDPSKRYMVQVRSSLLQYNRRSFQPRILVSIHREENVTTTLQVLEASNPTKSSRLSVFVLNLKELRGRSTSILVPNFKRGRVASTLKHEHIVNAFAYYEDHQSQGNVLLQHFTAVSPYASMHDDICNLALDKRVTIVILPFHKQWDIDGTVGAIFPAIRAVNLHVLSKAPCTVGILVDRKQIGESAWTPLTGQSVFRVALLFLGGIDGREAFAYASRMADHPRVTLSVVWIRPGGKRNKGGQMEDMEDPIDIELMQDFKAMSKGNGNIVFKEERVEDVVGTTKVIHSVEDSGFDLFVVGRYHDPSSPLVMGMTEWSDCPELGVLGDMLATSEFKFSILVIQQQPLGDVYLEKNYQNTKTFQDPIGYVDDQNRRPV